uniref:Uncharacterized protein n=1 Tax=Romanomermis culicivorax TaxID=13658 RepID=A0A915HPA6_ROMCU
MRQTLPALPKATSAQGYSLPKSDFDIACCCSGSGTEAVVGFAAAAEIGEAGQRKLVNDTKNNWGHQRTRVILTDRRYTGTSCTFYCPRTAAPNAYRLWAVHCAVEEASRNVWPTAVVAASPSTTTTGAQTLAVIAQQQPVANAFGEMLRAIKDDVSIIKASPFPRATAPQSPKIGVLHEVRICGGLVIDFPGEDPVSSDDDDEE